MSNPLFKLKLAEGTPQDFSENVLEVISRILKDPAVLGIVYFKQSNVHLCTVPTSMRRAMTILLPPLSPAISQAVTEMDVLDELIAYRIQSKTCEILVTGGKDIGCVVVQTRKSDKKKRKKVYFKES